MPHPPTTKLTNTPKCGNYLGPFSYKHRGVAQGFSALAWGARGRGFNSRRPDFLGSTPFSVASTLSNILQSLLVIVGHGLTGIVGKIEIPLNFITQIRDGWP